MADPATYRPAPGEIPTDPGVYRFRDPHGRVIYVGKAKNLRARLSSYFQNIAALHPRTQTMVTTASSVEWTVVRTEVEAFALEYTWIKEYNPRFNVMYRDDKSYPYLAVTMGEQFPRIQIIRGKKKKGTRYFGPYAHTWAIRETVDLLLRIFPVRTCSAGVFKAAQRSGRPCLLGYIDKCSAPCVGRVTEEEHRLLALDFCAFMAGETGKYKRKLSEEMKEASVALDYERAAKLRDDIAAIDHVMEKNAVVLPDNTDTDIFGLAQDDLEAAVQVFHVRGGRIRGQRGWVVEKVEDINDAELMERLLQQIYGDVEPASIPPLILLPVLPEDSDEAETWLSNSRGAAVHLRVPQRGEKFQLAETVTKNAQQALNIHRLRRSSDLTTRSQALREIQEALGLDEAPLRIECYDISNLQQTHIVGSMVVFEDGLPRKSEYRRFTITGELTDGATDDTAAIYEVLTRRFRRYIQERMDTDSPEVEDISTSTPDDPEPEVVEEKKKFAYPPNLLVIDGGKPQVDAAARALSDLGIDDIGLCGLAKRLEEVWLPGQEFPVIMPRGGEGLYLLQRVRDEAHRFAITYHRTKRGKAMTTSLLDTVPGLGPARQAELLSHFGSIKAIREADINALCEVPGIGPHLAEAIQTTLAQNITEPAVNVTTGEVLE